MFQGLPTILDTKSLQDRICHVHFEAQAGILALSTFTKLKEYTTGCTTSTSMLYM
uniref:Uncharacterized protein n=1 Tax=Anguilla anguilla TaxID=7936 RepID=A0A0E9TRE6_ANGAN